MVVPTRHGNSRAVPTPRANFCCHVARSAPFRAETVGQSHSLNGMTNMNTKRTTHGDQWSPCVVRRAGHDKQKCDLWPCPTHDAPASEKPVGRRPKKGYAGPPLLGRDTGERLLVLSNIPWTVHFARIAGSAGSARRRSSVVGAIYARFRSSVFSASFTKKQNA